MRRSVLLLSALSLGIAACTMASPNGVKTGKTLTTKASPPSRVTPTPKPASSLKPTLLEGPTALLKGKIEIDAHYIVSNKAGTIVANNGASSIALNAGTLISDNGLGLISDNGLGLISDKGFGLIANNAGTFRLLAADGVALGTILPVKGMAVFPLSLRTGEVVGRPALTDAKGQYALVVPEAVKGNIRLVARIPVAKADDPIAQDPRVRYDMVVAERADEPVIDEDTSIAARYIRACSVSRLTKVMVVEDANVAAGELGFPKEIEAFLLSTIKELNLAGKAAGARDMKPAEQEALGQRVTDITLSYVALADVQVSPADYGETGPKVNAVAAMADFLKVVRTAATAKMTADPAYFAKQAWVESAHWSRPIKKPADVCDFVIDNYLLDSGGKDALVVEAFQGIGVPLREVDRINAIYKAILTGVGQTLLSDPQAKASILAEVKATKP